MAVCVVYSQDNLSGTVTVVVRRNYGWVSAPTIPAGANCTYLIRQPAVVRSLQVMTMIDSLGLFVSPMQGAFISIAHIPVFAAMLCTYGCATETHS